MPREPFPSARQASCAGLKRQFYPAHVRHLVDYDYEARLPLAARQWLAAFTEEHYRGWRLKRETQLSVDLAREGGRRSITARRHGAAELHARTDTHDGPTPAAPCADVIELLDAAQQRARTAALSSSRTAPSEVDRANRRSARARAAAR